MSLVFLLYSLIALPIQAYDNTREVLIRATPFDHKLAGAGMLSPDHPALRAIGRAAGVERHFMEARSFRYIKDRNGDRWQSPDETDAKRSGDCEDKSVWLYSRLKQSGQKDARLVIGKYRRSDRVYHVWVTVRNEAGDLLVLDPTTQKKVWRKNDFSADFYVPIYSYDGASRYSHQRV